MESGDIVPRNRESSNQINDDYDKQNTPHKGSKKLRPSTPVLQNIQNEKREQDLAMKEVMEMIAKWRGLSEGLEPCSKGKTWKVDEHEISIPAEPDYYCCPYSRERPSLFLVPSVGRRRRLTGRGHPQTRLYRMGRLRRLSDDIPYELTSPWYR